jgi:mRNA-degrading endonuclease HigB of HigAB toxin-antitoxin module
VIDTPVSLTLNRAELVGHLASNAYWSNTSNWSKVYLYYSDSTKKQAIPVIFGSTNTAVFQSSSRVKQSRWTLEKIVIKDHERGLITLSRSKYFLALSACDFVVSVPNRVPSNIFLSNTSVVENTTFVGNLTATDPDIEDPLVYSVISGFGDAASFQIVGDNALHFVTAPNFEIKNQYSVKIRVTDSSDTFYEKAFTINVVDANDAPSNITLSNNTIYENAAINTVIGTLSATDEDAGATATFSIVGGDTASFNITGNQLRASESFNYEVKALYSVTVRATDNGGLTYDKVFNISVLNVNESPTGITLSSSSINEYNAINAVVGMLTTADPDGGDTFTYTIGGPDLAAFNINGNQLRASQVFDYETKSSYSIEIRSTDAGGYFFQKSFTINVNNIIEAPTDITLSANSINENAAVNTVIGTLGVVAPTAQLATYVIIGGDTSSFNIFGNQLRSSASFDFETKSSYSITIQATVGGEGFNKTFTINVNNIAEPPSDILLSSSSIAENNAVNTVIGTLSAVGDTCTYSIIGGDTSAFNINGSQLRASIAFDRESKSSYSVIVRGTTPFNQTFDKALTITVTEVDEFAPTGLVAWGGTIRGTDMATYNSASYNDKLFRIGVWDNDYSDYSQYLTRGAGPGKTHVIYQYQSGTNIRLYYTDGTYTTTGWIAYQGTSDVYDAARLGQDSAGYYLSKFEHMTFSGGTPSYFWMKFKVYYGLSDTGSYIDVVMTFPYGS